MSFSREEMAQLLREIDECASRARWEEKPVELGGCGTKSFAATIDNWQLLVVSFDIEPQGFPKGSRGYDGTAVRGPCKGDAGILMRLTRELAEKFFKAAEGQKP